MASHTSNTTRGVRWAIAAALWAIAFAVGMSAAVAIYHGLGVPNARLLMVAVAVGAGGIAFLLRERRQ